MRISIVSLACVMLISLCGMSSGNDTKKDDGVAVTVNGKAIMENEVETKVEAQLQSITTRMGGTQKINPQQLKQLEMYREILKPQILDKMIADLLLENAIKKENVRVADAELDAALEEMVQQTLTGNSLTREQLNSQLKTRGTSLQDYLTKIKTNPEFVESIRMKKFIETGFAKELAVTEKDVKDHYQKNLKTQYSQPEMVRASHILASVLDENRKPKSDEEKTKAKKKIEEVQKELKKPGADFAELAKKYSDCPSKSRGGDLNFFKREGMVAPFSAAAFSMKIGQISDVVETKFGYHVIKVTDRKEPKASSLEEVKDKIHLELKGRKIQQVTQKYISDLRKNAKIEYPKGKEPKKPAMPTGKKGACSN